MDDGVLDRYASLVVRIGANVQPGQSVYVLADIAHAAVARAVAEQAYAAGARGVVVSYDDAVVRLSALRHAPLETLTSVPEWQNAQLREISETGAAIIRLTGNADPHLFDGIDPARIAALPRDYARAFRQTLLAGNVTWTAVAAPNAGWATQVFGKPDLERLWEVVSIAMRLDEPDVVAAWSSFRELLAAKAAAVQALDLDAVRYHGGGTDLTVGLIPGSKWTGGSMTTSSGVAYMPNLPTEEVFTSPDRRRADGTLRLTRPLVMPRAGVQVEGLVVEFAGGRIVDATASSGLEAILAELDSDEGARSLGEVSLVDGSSRVRKAGVVFHDTLYDENAGCHVAWGQSFPFTVEGGLGKVAGRAICLGAQRFQRAYRRRGRRTRRPRRRHHPRRPYGSVDPRRRVGAARLTALGGGATVGRGLQPTPIAGLPADGGSQRQLARAAKVNSAPLAGRAGPSLPTAQTWLVPGTTAASQKASIVWFPSAGLGLVEIDHALPLKCSASERKQVRAQPVE